MGCPSIVVFGDNLTFSVTTHDPDTAVLTDADSVPSYRVYEDETATAILTGSMAKLDDGNTTGFYTETIACTTANGFEDGKTYTVYITAAVGGATGGICYGFITSRALAKGSNKWATEAGVLTVYARDDVTALFTETLTSDAASEPIIGADPAT